MKQENRMIGVSVLVKGYELLLEPITDFDGNYTL